MEPRNTLRVYYRHEHETSFLLVCHAIINGKALGGPMSFELRYPHVAAKIFDVPLMIAPAKLDMIISGLSARFGLDSPKHEAYIINEQENRDYQGYRVIRGVAIIDVVGILAHRVGMSPDSTRIQGYEDLGNQLSKAIQDSQVSSILLNIDSPGGEVSGAFQFAEQVYLSRGIKPIHAIASDCAASAAYLIASAADSLSMTSTALVGSIGVVMRHIDVSEAMEKQGVHVTHIYAGEQKIDGHPYAPLPKEVYDRFKASVDYYYDLFVEAVAKHRPALTPSVIRSTEAGMFVADKALVLGLVDRIETTDQLLMRLQENIVPTENVINEASEKKLESLSALNIDLQSKLNSLQDNYQSSLADLKAKLSVEAEQAKLATEKAQSLENELNAFKAEVRRNAVKALFSDLHREWSDEAAQPYLDMSDASFSAVAKDLRSMKPALKADYFKDTTPTGAVSKSEQDFATQLFAQVAGSK